MKKIAKTIDRKEYILEYDYDVFPQGIDFHVHIGGGDSFDFTMKDVAGIGDVVEFAQQQYNTTFNSEIAQLIFANYSGK